MFIPETESGNYQECIILFKESGQTVCIGGIWLLSRLIVFLKRRVDHFTSRIRVAPHYPESDHPC